MFFRWLLLHWCLFFAARLSFFIGFSSSPSKHEVLKALYIGSKFDFRLAFFLALPLAVLFLIKKWHPARNKKTLRLLTLYSLSIFSFCLLIYFTDFAYYSYLKTRLNSSVVAFLTNIGISVSMVWESYPVVWMTLGFFTVVFLYYKILKWVLFKVQLFNNLNKKVVVLLSFLSLLLSYGKIGFYPLRWSEAFFSTNNFYNYLAVNPILYFLETYKFSKQKPFDQSRVDAFRPLIEKFIQAEWKEQDRTPVREFFEKRGDGKVRPKNVVIIVMESMAYGKTSLAGNPLDTSPNLKAVSDKGHSFTRYFAPHEGTARNMFGITTSVTDVTRYKTSSRNPMVVDQRVIANDFKGYERFYFIGGSANWANIRAVFSNNIEGIHVVEEGMHKGERVDVWGISDLDLLIEANDRMASEKKPFIATIQLAGFHRPYTIPDKRGDFEEWKLDKKAWSEAGFHSLQQLNSLRFSDYALGEYFKRAKKEKYFSDTLFVITGDHGIPHDNGVNVSEGYKAHNLENYHVPLIFYHPPSIPAVVDQRVAWEMDIMPTVGQYIGLPFKNTTLGRDLMNPKYNEDRLAFIFDNYAPTVTYAVIYENFFYKYRSGAGGNLYDLVAADPTKPLAQDHQLYSRLENWAHMIYEMSRYLLYNNKKNKKE